MTETHTPCIQEWRNDAIREVRKAMVARCDYLRAQGGRISPGAGADGRTDAERALAELEAASPASSEGSQIESPVEMRHRA